MSLTTCTVLVNKSNLFSNKKYLNVGKSEQKSFTRKEIIKILKVENNCYLFYRLFINTGSLYIQENKKHKQKTNLKNPPKYHFSVLNSIRTSDND